MRLLNLPKHVILGQNELTLRLLTIHEPSVALLDVLTMIKHLARLLVNYLAFGFYQPEIWDRQNSYGADPTRIQNSSVKAIAIVGAGSAGLAALKSLLDLPIEVRREWDIVLYEQRRDVGGVWLPDLNDPQPPELPETPLYPELRTNTPSPSMTYPHFPFREMTSLYPNHKHVWEYHKDYADHYGLTHFMRVNTTVLSSAWVGNASRGHWNIAVRNASGQNETQLFDHLIVANGHNHYPNIPTWPGQENWLASNSEAHEILHSIFWRNATKYKGKTVLVAGAGASGSDALLHVAPVAKKLFLSLKDDKLPPARVPSSVYARKPEIANFTTSSVVFADGSTSDEIDSIILATGYEYRVPFLSAGGALPIDEKADSCPERAPTLTTNLRYIFPLHEHIFSLADSYPTNALAFVGLPMLISNCPSDIAQSLLVAHAIANSSLLPSREAMVEELRAKETRMRTHGIDPYTIGHRMLRIGGDGEIDSAAQDYQDGLFEFLKEQKAVPDEGRAFVEPWRRWTTREASVLWAAWRHLESLGDHAVKAWLRGVKTEADWVHLMKRLVRWELDQSVEVVAP